MSEIPEPSLDEIFTSIDKKLSLNLAKEITDDEIERVYQYYFKEKIRFDQDQSQFIKPGRKAKSKHDITKILDSFKF